MIKLDPQTNMRHLPAPTFTTGSIEGGITMEWCYGKHGAVDSWRVFLDWGPDGVWAVRMHAGGSDETADWAVFTDWLAQEPPGGSPAELEYENQRR